MVLNLVYQTAITTAAKRWLQRTNNVKLASIAEFDGDVVFTKITRGIGKFTAEYLIFLSKASVDIFRLIFSRAISAPWFLLGAHINTFAAGDKNAL